MKIVCIIQARMGSNRLPGKTLMRIKGKTIIEHVVSRVSKAVDEVVVATSTSSKDNILAQYLENKNINCFRGSENDVLERYYLAAKKYNADLIVRVCGDQPLVDPFSIEMCLPEVKENDFTYCKHEQGWPDGTGCEIITFKALEKAQLECKSDFEREHIKPYFLNNKDSFKIKTVDAPLEIQNQELHLAIDTKEDFERLKVRMENSLEIAIISSFKNFMKESTNITILSLAKELQKRGHQIKIYSNIGKKKKYFVEGVRVIQNGFDGKKSWWNPAYVKNQLLFDVGEVELIHHFSSSPLLSLRGLFADGNKKIHTMKSFPGKKGSSLGISLLKRYDAVTVPTNYLKEKLKNVKNVHLVRSCIDLEKFVPKDKEILRNKYGYSGKIIFYYGALREEKGIHNLVAALPSNVKLIIGSRASTNDVKGLTEKIKKDLKVGNKDVEIIIQDIDVVDYINMADLVVMAYPTLEGTEGNPSCVLETMACKTPLITSDLPELKEILDGVAFCKAGDVDDLREKIDYVLSNEVDVSRAYLISQQFSIAKMADEFEKVYKSVR